MRTFDVTGAILTPVTGSGGIHPFTESVQADTREDAIKQVHADFSDKLWVDIYNFYVDTTSGKWWGIEPSEDE